MLNLVTYKLTGYLGGSAPRPSYRGIEVSAHCICYYREGGARRSHEHHLTCMYICEESRKVWSQASETTAVTRCVPTLEQKHMYISLLFGLFYGSLRTTA